MPFSRSPRSGVAQPRPFLHPDPARVRFARQPIVDGSIEPLGHELSFRWGDGTRRNPPPPGPYAVSVLLSQALLDGGLAQRRPGLLFVEMEAATLLSPIADVLCGSLGVIQLPASLRVDPSVTRRIAQLHARGYRFALGGLTSSTDERLQWLPMLAFLKLDAALASPGGWSDLMTLSRRHGVPLIAERVEDPTDYLRLRERGLRFFEGDLITPPQEESPRALPSCDMDVVGRVYGLARQGVPHDALAMLAGSDPALVVRLLMLHRIYAGADPRPATLTEVLAGFPIDVLVGWLHILRACTFDLTPSGQTWSVAVREQIYNYRARLIVARACGSPAELEAKVFDLYRRLCSREP
jgi:hypothetical protein